ncbi:MAG: myo-inositol 2-dehydrogenase / D-chiro-inositol 1-dehydrogenase [Gaiellaceae bacterium]|jgi:myo-inositol 2-dehydrogenase/D-chiro-inositol 1-dehydrogenase|nr:myo-inositol 2-dehydrogenase / D-chiro-inositol 1-dehydrogenase [Gaiellaceae bacterium]
MPQRDGLHIGVVGVGRIGLFHARTLLGLDGVEGLTVADADGARAKQVSSELGVHAAETPEALVEAGVDALVIATTTPGHIPSLALAARAALPAFCEKPVSLDLATLDDLIEEVEHAGTLVQVGFQRRFDAGYRAARDAVAAGTLGNLLVLRAATHDPTPPPQQYIAVSGGIFRDLHIHDFDAIRFVTGQEIVEVYADGAVRETGWFEQYGDVDTAAALLRLGEGTLAVVTGTRHDPLGYDVRLEVFGTGDSIAVGLEARSALRSVEPGAMAPRVPGYANFMERFEAGYRDELAAFVSTVRQGGSSPCPLTEARAALVAALAADRSRIERRPISIEEVSSAQAVTG